MWSGIQPEGSALSFPNEVTEHLGERPTEQHEGIVSVTGRCRFWFFDPSMTVAESLARSLMGGMETSPIAVGDDTNVRLFRESYTVNPSAQRGPSGQFVFQAAVVYSATFDV